MYAPLLNENTKQWQNLDLALQHISLVNRDLWPDMKVSRNQIESKWTELQFNRKYFHQSESPLLIKESFDVSKLTLGDKWAFWFATGENDEARWHQKISVAHCANKPGASTRTHRRKLYSKERTPECKMMMQGLHIWATKALFWEILMHISLLNPTSIVLKPVFADILMCQS